MSDVKNDLCEACDGSGLKNASTLCPECKGTPSAKERKRLEDERVVGEKANLAKPNAEAKKSVKDDKSSAATSDEGKAEATDMSAPAKDAK